MGPNLLKHRGDSWRLALLGLTLVVVVLLPAIFLRRMADQTQQAVALVAATHQVKAEVSLLLANARDVEAAALTMASGIDTPRIRARFNQSSAAIRPTLDRITRLTRDNPEQQVRIGVLLANLEQRIGLAREIIRDDNGDREPILSIVRDMTARYPIHDISQEIIATQEKLLEERTLAAEAQQQRSDILRTVAVVAQLLALSLIAFFWLRQLRAREAAEVDRQRANKRAQAVLQSVREPIVLLDGEQNVLMYNTAFSELYGLELDVGETLALADVGDGVWRDPAVLERLRDVLRRDRELWDYEQVQRTADGDKRTMLLNALRMPLPDSDDRVVLMTATDITARKAAEVHIRDLNHQLEGKVDQVSEINLELEAFSYSVSHDLRAPLRHISGFADKLRRHLGDGADDKTLHYVEVMGNSAKRMSALIDDLLVYSRLGRSALRLQAVDMQSLADDTRSLLESNLAHDAPGRHIEWHIAPLPILVADENMMRQLWLNLLGNAVKYTGGKDPAEIGIEYQKLADGRHVFTVRDNGAGFDMQYADKLFGVFQRMHKASEYPGTGVGLASVRRILLRHRGSIRAESAPDAGASFHFTLPANLDNSADAPQTGPKTA